MKLKDLLKYDENLNVVLITEGYLIDIPEKVEIVRFENDNGELEEFLGIYN